MKTTKLLLSILVPVLVAGLFYLSYQFIASERSKRDGQRLTDIGHIRSALEKFRADNNAYPGGPDLVLGSDSAECLSSVGFSHGGSATGNLYMYTVPKDPQPGRSYLYSHFDDGQNYQIKFETEGPTAGYLQPGKHTVGPPTKP